MSYCDSNTLHAHALLHSGRYVNLLAPTPGDIGTDDIAHHLATVNRWCGAAVRPYSVAEHSLLVMTIMADILGVTCPAQLLAGLLHDAHEAYLHDITRPQQQALASFSLSADGALHELRARWDRAIHNRYGVLTAAQNARHAIKRADLMALAIERQQLLTEQATPWPVLDGLQSVPPDWVDLQAHTTPAWADVRDLMRDCIERMQAYMLERSAALGGRTA